MGGHSKLGVTITSTGAKFAVWAPFAENVAVTGVFNNWGRSPLESDGSGNWTATVEGVQPGQEYKYVISIGGQEHFKNDPRTLQMTTNAGNSVVADPEFDWQGDDFAPVPRQQQVIYELHIGTFNRTDAATPGTFKTAIDKLDYLKALGINTVELMPICSMTMDRGWGYAPDYIYAVESMYGSRGGFLEFVRAAHERGIGVVLDVVYNHFGPDNNLDMWQFDGWSQDGKGGIYFYNDWRSTTPWGEVRPDYGRPEVQDYITENVQYWLKDCHVDGLRLDSTIYMRNVQGHNNDISNDLPDAWLLMQKINDLAYKLKPSALMIAEDSSGNDYMTKPSTDGGAGFGSQWQVTFPHAVREALDGPNDADRNLHSIKNELLQHYNGDAFQRVIYSDSHDSSSNGSARLNEEITPGDSSSLFARRRSLLASAIVLTTPGIPMLLQGQEFMQSGSFSDWQALEWDNAEEFAGIVEAHKHLIALRNNEHANTAGLSAHSVDILHLDDASKVLAYHRWDKGGPLDDTVIILNFSNTAHENYELPFPADGTWHVRLNSDWKGYSPDFTGQELANVASKDGRATITIAPYSVLILSQDKS